MAKNPFRYDGTLDNQPNRNVFDLSFQNNSTFKFGQITPVMCKEVLAGDSFQMKPTFAINFMPMTFPIQTRMRAYLHFYYVRHRNVWKDWEDFFGGTKQGLTMPYLAPNSDEKFLSVFGTGSLGDYLGLPTSQVGEYGQDLSIPLQEYTDGTQGYLYKMTTYSTGTLFSDSVVHSPNISQDTAVGIASRFISALNGNIQKVVFNFKPSSQTLAYYYFAFYDKSDRLVQFSKTPFGVSPVLSSNNSVVTLDMSSANLAISQIGRVAVFYQFSSSGANNIEFSEPIQIVTDYLNITGSPDYNATPYFSRMSPSGALKINALPFRGYEMIYNVFYRNSQNNPYILNGVAEYNKYIPTDEGGADENLYKLRFRNWEDDFLTTAVQSPQQGVAPLVGLTNRDATVTLAAENGTVTRYTLSTNEDGSVNGVEASDSGNPQLTMALVDAVSYGISIEDFRNVNALQRWLEINIRKGYKYSEVLEAHFGVNIRYNALDMPEFIGGASQDIFVNRISQTNNQTDSEGLPLGWQSGQASCVGSGETITHYFDEPGYVFAMLTIVPVPNYSQLLPKHFIKKDLLDYYFPEFGHIGFQPITYKEVCPIQANGESPAVLDQTFGYQRPWYEYLASNDEVHADFRTTLRNFVLNRTFDIKPELSESFLLVDPEQLNDVFNYQADTDKILGQVYFDIKAKRPIPLYGIPKLE